MRKKCICMCTFDIREYIHTDCIHLELFSSRIQF